MSIATKEDYPSAHGQYVADLLPVRVPPAVAWSIPGSELKVDELCGCIAQAHDEYKNERGVERGAERSRPGPVMGTGSGPVFQKFIDDQDRQPKQGREGWLRRAVARWPKSSNRVRVKVKT